MLALKQMRILTKDIPYFEHSLSQLVIVTAVM
jgi:hypothetical protein